MTPSPRGVVRIVRRFLRTYPPKHGGDHGKAGQHGQHEEGGFHASGHARVRFRWKTVSQVPCKRRKKQARGVLIAQIRINRCRHLIVQQRNQFGLGVIEQPQRVPLFHKAGFSNPRGLSVKLQPAVTT